MFEPVDPQPVLLAHVTAELPDYWGSAISVRSSLPNNWKATDAPQVLLRPDASLGARWPIETYSTLRIVAFSNNENLSMRLCRAAQTIVLAFPGGDGVGVPTFLTGPQPGVDDSTKAQIAAATVRVKAAARIA